MHTKLRKRIKIPEKEGRGNFCKFWWLSFQPPTYGIHVFSVAWCVIGFFKWSFKKIYYNFKCYDGLFCRLTVGLQCGKIKGNNKNKGT